MAESWEQLRGALPSSWKTAGVTIDKDLHLVIGGVTIARITEADTVPRIKLLGSALSLAFVRDGDERYVATLDGRLAKLASLDAFAATEGRFELTLSPKNLWPLGDRLNISLASGLTASVVIDSNSATLLLRNTSDRELEASLRLNPSISWKDAAGTEFEFELPFEDLIVLTLRIPALEARAVIRLDSVKEIARLAVDAFENATASIRTALRGAVPSLLTGDAVANYGLVAPDIGGEIEVGSSGDKIVFKGVTIRSGELALDGTIEIDTSLRIGSSEKIGSFAAIRRATVLADASAPFTFVLRTGAMFELYAGSRGWRLTTPTTGGAATGALVVPGLSREQAALAFPDAGAGVGLEDRFVLDFVSEQGAAALSIGTEGFSVTGRVRTIPIRIPGLTDVRVTSGTIQIRNGDWQLRLEAEAGLPWFRNARGRIRVEGARTPDGHRFGAMFQVTITEGWTDASGVIKVTNPSVTASLDWKDGQWMLDGFVGGTLVFGKVPFVGDAESWVGEIFKDVNAEFERIGLRELENLWKSMKGLTVTLRRPMRIPVWDIFNFEIDGLTLYPSGGISFHGLVGFALGELRFEGSLPELKLLVARGKLSLDVNSPTSFRGLLTAPSGLRVQMGFKRDSSEVAEILSGDGSITGPTIPDIGVMVRVGRFRKAAGMPWRPTIAVFADVPTNTPIMPGIVLKRIGVGFGIYQSLRGIDQVDSVASAFRLLSSGALPQPGKAESWQVDPNTEISLVAQSLIAATTASPEVPDYYVTDLVISLDSQLRLAGFGTMWIFTSPNDARTAEFRERPYARGVVLLDGTEPSLIAAYQSEPNPSMSIRKVLGPATAVLNGVLGAIRTRASLEARPGLFALTLGPNDVAFSLDFFKASGRTLLGVRASKAGAHVVASVSLAASFDVGASIGIGPATVGVRAAAGFSMQAMLYGGIIKGELMMAAQMSVLAYARLTVHLEIRFSIRIRAGFVKITIRWSKSWDFRFELQVDLDATFVIGSMGTAFDGNAKVSFRVMGIGVSMSLPVSAGEASLLAEAKHAMNAAKQGSLLPSGAK